ncbi:hypothetical protein DL98DRAFT_11664 [Cadophora sp. DSE1049]|nr:hypothetical protein DL98DRAFT_11664 [Cadophora sp. DSE1049]
MAVGPPSASCCWASVVIMGFSSFLRFLLTWFPPPLAEFATDLAFLIAASFIEDPFILRWCLVWRGRGRGGVLPWVGVCRLEGKCVR